MYSHECDYWNIDSSVVPLPKRLSQSLGYLNKGNINYAWISYFFHLFLVALRIFCKWFKRSNEKKIGSSSETRNQNDEWTVKHDINTHSTKFTPKSV